MVHHHILFNVKIYLVIGSLEVSLLGESTFTSSNTGSTSNASQSHQILCCAYNANGTIFVTGSSDSNARVCVKLSTLVILLSNAETVGYVVFVYF